MSTKWLKKFKSSRARAARPVAVQARLYVAEMLEQRLCLSTNVLSYHYDAASTGVNSTEVALTPSNVNAATFGKVGSTAVDGQVYAQPLYMSSVNITTGSSQGIHSVVFVATEHDSLYAIDAVNGSILWQDSFINPAAGITTVPNIDVSSNDLAPEIGITSTPVIDASTNTLFVTAKTKEVSGGNTHYVMKLHAIDIANGSEKFGGAVTIADTIYNGSTYTYVSGPSVNGTGDGSVNGKIVMNALRAHQRTALTLINGTVYIGFASHSDNGPYHGWLLGYNATNLALTAAFNATPGGGLGGIWQAAGKIASDSQGYLYLSTGNGSFDTTLDANGFPIKGDYGNSVIKLAVDPTSSSANQNVNGWGLKVVDYFTPFNQQALNQQDVDFGSGAPMILPDSAGSAAHPHLMVVGGKEGRIYLVDRDNMGKYDPNTDHVVQEVTNGVNGVIDTPAFFQNRLYYVGSYTDVAKSFTVSNGIISTVPSSQSADSYTFPGATPVISANGTANAIMWAIDKGSNQLRAYDATNLTNELYTSAQAASGRDLISAVKFSSPIVADGRVYVGTNNSLAIFGILPPPTSTPAAPSGLVGSASSPYQITLSWINNATNQAGVKIEQSEDGTNFTEIGTVGVYGSSFTASGLQPGTQYVFRVRAYNSVGNSGYSATATVATPNSAGSNVIDFSSGFTAGDPQLKLNGAAKVTGSALQLTDGGNGQTSSAFGTTAVKIDSFTTWFSFQQLNASADGMTFTIQGFGPTALGSGGGGLGYGGITQSAAVKIDLFSNAGEGSNSTGLYTNGSLPTLPATDLTSANVDLHSGHVFNALLNYNGSTLTVSITDASTNLSATQSYSVNLPGLIGSTSGYVGFTAATGGLSANQNILNWKYVAGPVAPTNVQTIPVTPTQVNLTWLSKGTTQSGFNIEQSTDGVNFAQVAQTFSPARSFLIGGLQPATTYFFRIRAYNGQKLSDYSNISSITTASGAGSALLDFTNGFANSASQLSYNFSAKIVGSALSLTDGGMGEHGAAFTTNAVNINSFTTSFNFQTLNASGDGFTFCIQGAGPGSIGNTGMDLGYGGITTKSIAVKFDLYSNAGEGANSTGLYLSGATPTLANSIDLTGTGIDLHSGHVFNVSMTYNGTTLAVTIKDTATNATATQSYTVDIPKIIGGTAGYVGFTGGTGGATATQNILSWTFRPAPAAPKNLVATAVSNSEIDLTWTENATNQTGFKIERSTDGVTFAPLVTIGNVTSYADTSFTVGQLYYYRVRATIAVGDSIYSNTSTAIAPTPPATPTNVHATLITANELDLAWNDNANNEDNYVIYRKTGSAGTFSLIATLPANTTSYNDTDGGAGLAAGTQYVYHIQAVNISGFNDFAGVTLSTLPAAPTQFTAVAGDGNVDLNWNASVGATSYSVYRGLTPGGEAAVPVITGLTTTSFTDPSLTGGTTYYYQVTAVNSSGEGARSQEAFATPNAPGPSLEITTPEAATAGNNCSITITAKDTNGNVNAGYRGTVHFTSSDPAAILPANYTFTAADQGVHAFNVVLKTAGSRTVTATDNGSPSLVVSDSITVNASSATQLVVSGFPTSVTAGVSNNLTVTAKDAYGNVATGYSGTVRITSSDGQAALPANATLLNGVRAFAVTLKSAGSRSITATDTVTGSLTGTISNITVAPAAASTFVLTGVPSQVTAGNSGTFTVTAKDAYGNTVTGYTGTVRFTSSDTQAVLPANYTFTGGDAGTHTFSATLKTAGARTITTTDTANASMNATSSAITVKAATAVKAAVTTPALATAGTGFSVTVTIQDAYGNTATGYVGTIRFTSNDAQAVLPPNYTFTSGDAGVRVFTTTLKTAGTKTLTATDTVTASITGSASVSVKAGAAVRVSVVAPTSVSRRVAFNMTVTLFDAYNNIATGYLGTLHFTSTEPGAQLPADYTFAAADAGIRVFTVMFKTKGNDTVTATDKSNSSLTATSNLIAVS